MNPRFASLKKQSCDRQISKKFLDWRIKQKIASVDSYLLFFRQISEINLNQHVTRDQAVEIARDYLTLDLVSQNQKIRNHAQLKLSYFDQDLISEVALYHLLNLCV